MTDKVPCKFCIYWAGNVTCFRGFRDSLRTKEDGCHRGRVEKGKEYRLHALAWVLGKRK